MKKVLIRLVQLIIFLAFIIYIIPPFEINFLNSWFIYKGLPNLFGDNSSFLNFQSVNLGTNYEYVLKSNSSPDNKTQKYLLAYKDANVLSERLKNYVGNAFQIKTWVDEHAIYHSIILNVNLNKNENILTNLNDKFELLKNVNVSNNNNDELNAGEIQSFQNNSEVSNTINSKEETLNLSRGDFGYAEITENFDFNKNKFYQVRLPISYFLNYEKFKIIEDNMSQDLSINIAGLKSKVFFDQSQNNKPIGLLIGNFQDKFEALLIKSLLNSSSLGTFYSIDAKNYLNQTLLKKILNVFALIAGNVVLILLIFLIKKIQLKSKYNFIFWLLFLNIFVLSIFKLFNLVLTLDILVLLCLINLLLLISHRIYVILLLGVLTLLKVMVLLNGFDVSFYSLLILIMYSFLVYPLFESNLKLNPNEKAY